MLLRAPVAQRPLVTWPASSSLSSESPVLQGPSWPQRPHGPSHGDLLDHALADVDVVPLDSDSCRLTTHVLVVLPVLQGSTGRVTVPGAAAPRGRSPARAEQPAFLGRGAQPRQPCLRNALRGRQPGQPWKHVHTLIWRVNGIGTLWGFKGASQVAFVVKNRPANAGDIRDEGSSPRLGRSPGGGNGNPLQ